MTALCNLNERVLERNYPVYAGFMYAAVYQDGSEDVVRANSSGTVGTLLKLPQNAEVKELKNCDIKGRKLWDHMI